MSVPRVLQVSLLLFGSGMSALIYQTVWMREFRLIFGMSTLANAAVLSIFMGGVGIGSFVLGRRVDHHPQPLFLYAKWEFFVTLSAALTPIFLLGVDQIYVSVGGSSSLGEFLATAVRLFLTFIALCLPTFYMGGTLPAAVRAIGKTEDFARTDCALLYGVNTLGAVTGVLLAVFYCIEHFGHLHTLWAACLINATLAGVAYRLAPCFATPPREPSDETAARSSSIVWFAAAVSGFVFFFMEIVWYRMLSPVLGGSVYTFGLILVAVLLGIGAGGIAYAFSGKKAEATYQALAFSFALEALAIIFPYAMGDRIAILALSLRQSAAESFLFTSLGWLAIALLVVFPTAFVAGIQFPLIVSLGRKDVGRIGRQVGQVYAWNTGGAIAGAIVGGFGALPLLMAKGAWNACAIFLIVCAIGIGARSIQEAGFRRKTVGLAALIGFTIVLFFSNGPTAMWRHTGIGAGTTQLMSKKKNDITRVIRAENRSILWEVEGREASLARREDTFIVNGKVDGGILGDAGTQIMAGLIGALLNPKAKHALVIGLGTGSSAGWLGEVPSLESVD
ncbi:MAG TPA: spermidine synthase, partial [Bdellovibrionota bacterium]|nr:spermidine synthase [Bdellovibrionota bacterium]